MKNLNNGLTKGQWIKFHIVKTLQQKYFGYIIKIENSLKGYVMANSLGNV
jgi:hypothetical protein